MAIRYKYRTNTHPREPLLTCPVCQHNLTRPGGIMLTLSVGGHTLDVETALDQDGNLRDTADGAVSAGLHSLTCCGSCQEQLVEYETRV